MNISGPHVLTAAQLRLLGEIGRFRAEHGYPPGIRDLQAVMGYLSPNGVMRHLDALGRKGLIDGHRTRQARTLRCGYRFIPADRLGDWDA